MVSSEKEWIDGQIEPVTLRPKEEGSFSSSFSDIRREALDQYGGGQWQKECESQGRYLNHRFGFVENNVFPRDMYNIFYGQLKCCGEISYVNSIFEKTQ